MITHYPLPLALLHPSVACSEGPTEPPPKKTGRDRVHTARVFRSVAAVCPPTSTHPRGARYPSHRCQSSVCADLTLLCAPCIRRQPQPESQHPHPHYDTQTHTRAHRRLPHSHTHSLSLSLSRATNAAIAAIAAAAAYRPSEPVSPPPATVWQRLHTRVVHIASRGGARLYFVPVRASAIVLTYCHGLCGPVLFRLHQSRRAAVVIL